MMILSKIKILLNRTIQLYISKTLYEEELTKKNNTYVYERSIEYAFALEKLIENKVLNVLDIGTGTNSFAATLRHCGYNVTASDKITGYWQEYFNRHIHVVQDDINNSQFMDNSFDAVTCISVLEHIRDFDCAIKSMSRLIKKKGIIILTFPYTWDSFCNNVYKLEEADKIAKEFNYIGRSYSDEQINSWTSENKLKVIEKKLFKGWTGKYWRTGDRINFPIIVNEKENANGICLLLKKR